MSTEQNNDKQTPKMSDTAAEDQKVNHSQDGRTSQDDTGGGDGADFEKARQGNQAENQRPGQGGQGGGEQGGTYGAQQKGNSSTERNSYDPEVGETD